MKLIDKPKNKEAEIIRIEFFFSMIFTD